MNVIVYLEILSEPGVVFKMNSCAVCAYTNPVKSVSCRQCGTAFKPIPTARVGSRDQTDKLRPVAPFHGQDEQFYRYTNIYASDTYLRLKIVGEPKPLMIEPRPEIILGRRDPTLPNQPDIDFSPFAGYRQGISRRHARIGCMSDGYMLISDLGSSNGTFLNDTRLEVQHTYRLRDGDKIALGKMVMYLYYH